MSAVLLEGKKHLGKEGKEKDSCRLLLSVVQEDE